MDADLVLFLIAMHSPLYLAIITGILWSDPNIGGVVGLYILLIISIYLLYKNLENDHGQQ